MNIDYKELKKGQFVEQETKKDLIVLHHTVSSTTSSALDWWNQTKERVAVSYIIEKSGNIVQTFDDKFWAWHLGSGINKIHSMRSIGIELVNEGILIKKGDKFFWMDGKYKYTGSIYTHPNEWRGSTYFSSYMAEQVKTCSDLVKYLIDKHKIKTDILTNYSFSDENINFKGIISHHNVRKDKTDVSPAFNLVKFKEDISNE